ncbi:complement component C8 gamma chain isoform X9 [Sarcophilus harrisii]|uniref:complement component C8 gamma chain isoform X9 n=1 Tax=Sarcophilus harrisii TaxID=9305 RepID=UPI001301C6B5|nr:complement component C8 gamma chain isoform X9 [Sarcophilus harrisii]
MGEIWFPHSWSLCFQGKWYVIGLAGRNINTESLRHYKMYATMYQLQADHSYRVISNLIKGESCDIGLRTFVPKGQPGQFALDNFKAYGVTKYVFRVVKTNYDEFAILFFLSVKKSKVNFMASLYGRTKELRSEPKEKFIEFAQALGLSDEFLLFLHKDDIPSSTVYSPPWLPLPSPSPSLSICC